MKNLPDLLSNTSVSYSQACFDVREGPKVWQKFVLLEKVQETTSVEWLSTHPSHENREHNLEDIVPEVRLSYVQSHLYIEYKCGIDKLLV